MPLIFSWHGSRPDGRSSGLSVQHCVGGSTRRASQTPSQSDTYFSGGSIINAPEFARRHFGMFVLRWNQTQVHVSGGPPSARFPRDARWVLGDRGFDWNDVDFLLFVTTEEIRWLQSGVLVPRVTSPPLRRRRHLRQWARSERRSRDRYRDAPALLPARTSSRGPLWTSVVSGLLRKKGKRCPLPPAPPALPPNYSTWASSSGPPRAPVFDASFSSVSWVGLSRPQEAAASGPRFGSVHFSCFSLLKSF